MLIRATKQVKFISWEIPKSILGNKYQQMLPTYIKDVAKANWWCEIQAASYY